MKSPKKISFQNTHKKKLVGLLWESPSDKCVIMTHGSGGNKSAQGLFDFLALNISQTGFAVFNFDFAGHGESDDEIASIDSVTSDTKSAIKFIQSLGYKHIILIGHSLGALACLRSYSPDIQTMILIGALTGPVDWNWADMVPLEIVETGKKTGVISVDINDGLRKTVNIDYNLLDDIRSINQPNLLSEVKCPVYIIHGNSGSQELDLLKSSEKGIPYLANGSRLDIINGASHSFLENPDQLKVMIIHWLKNYE